ncbi:uncharacterized protein LOC131215929 [Anopheles bellator]|uniref:uncharacterized protein LOC131215929 n=1 Tax=Anopheles bellator TaxID=139047 RepID=UPI0026487532|nr:uncharacterized protein LOC131215929 [Anopheles bellator]
MDRQGYTPNPGSGLSYCNSFEANQSFPRVGKRLSRYSQRFAAAIGSTGKSPLVISFDSTAKMDRVRVDGSNGVRFTAFRPKGGCYPHGVASPYNSSYIASTSESIGRLPKSDINPNKAVFTIDSRTSRILIVNRNACELLGYSSKELCEMEFTGLLLNKSKMHVSALAEGQLNSEDGTVIILSGKVVELCTKYDKNVAVSLWVRQIDTEGQRCLAVAEPVERRIAQVVVDKNGYIISGDNEALMLFQLDTIDKFNGMDIALLIPAILLPDADSSLIAKHIRKQKATGKTQDGVSFPLCLMISHYENGTDTTDSGLSNPNALLYTVTVWVYTNLSGLLVIDENSVIESCNHHFSMLMFGYPQSQTIGEHISKLIPNIGQDSDCLTRSRNATLSSLDNDESETETDHVELESGKDNFVPPCRGAVNGVRNGHVACCELASPSKEPRKVCLDFTSVSGNRSTVGSLCVSSTAENACTDTTKAQISSNDSELPAGAGGNESRDLSSTKEQPLLTDSAPFPEDNSENNPNYVNTSSLFSNNSIKSHSPALTAALEDYTNFADCDLLTPVNETGSVCMNLLGSKNASNNETKSGHYTTEDISSALLLKDSPASMGPPPALVTPRLVKPHEKASIITSTPDPQHKRHSVGGGSSNDARQTVTHGSAKPNTAYGDGKYRGEAIHHDGNVIDIIYTISNQTLPCGRKVYCIWISRDPESSYNHLEDVNVTLTFNSITSTIDNSVGGPGASKTAAVGTGGTNAGSGAPGVASSRPNSVSLMSQCEEEQVFGEYNKHYTTIKQIGKGAYGYVKLSYRNSDRLLVISKFILKEKLCSNFMITTEDKREIPMEIYLLTHVKHPNIVTVFDVFENEKFFQLVMEVHGSGMDLFEFIDRRPAMTEKLGCYIFRQIAYAVDYLHSMNILHRDIKDENIIIDQHFQVKLIDFGSATFMQDGKLFSTFYGTTEYCSPEVLAGNKYAGPELEMWSLGVTLYVLMFFENPFLDIEETLKSELIIPQEIGSELEYVLLALLDKNPKTRITMPQLLASDWLTQEIVSSAFNFAQIIPCEPYEVNPEKYYNGQIYSSQTGLSTSPHSLSLVDDDEGVNDDDDDDDEQHAHIEDFSIDPEELLEDDVCPLSLDDDPKPEQSITESHEAARDSFEGPALLAKTAHRMSLHDYAEDLTVPTAMRGGGEAVCQLPGASVPSQLNSCPEPPCATASVVESVGLVAKPPTVLQLNELPSPVVVCERPFSSGSKSNSAHHATLYDSSCSTTPSLVLPASSILLCNMMPPYSVLTSGDSCCSCSSVTTISSSCCSIDIEHHQQPFPAVDDGSTASSSAADTPTNCCSQEYGAKTVPPVGQRRVETFEGDVTCSNLLVLGDSRHYAASSSSTSPCSSLTSSKSENNIFDGKFATFSTIYDVVSMDNVTDAATAIGAADAPAMLPFHGYAISDLSRELAPSTAVLSVSGPASNGGSSAAANSGNAEGISPRGWRPLKK